MASKRKSEDLEVESPIQKQGSQNNENELSEDELTEEELNQLLEMEDPGVNAPIQKKLVHEWQAQERPYAPLNREMFTTVVAGVFLLGVILFVINGPIGGTIIGMFLASIVFLWYVMGTVKPQKAIFRIFTWGIEAGERLYPYDIMNRFWFEGKDENRMLVVELLINWPRHLRVMIDNEETEALLREILEDFIVEDQPKPNWLEKASTWIEKQIRWSLKS